MKIALYILDNESYAIPFWLEWRDGVGGLCIVFKNDEHDI
jgi:hypothetical protein